MQQLILPVLLASFWTICTGLDWCYQSQFTCDNMCNTPDKWGETYSDCVGKSQSPINIVTRKTLKDERLTPFIFTNYREVFSDTITNIGYSIKVGIPTFSTISGGGLPTTYNALQFHMHWGNSEGPGSEHTINGERYPMELHIIHVKKDYDDLETALSDPEGVAVLGFLFETSNTANERYDPLISALPSITAIDSEAPLESISLAQLIPHEKNLTSFYRYKGSLTTPGCNEAVIWTVFKNTIPLSMDQLTAFSQVTIEDETPMVGNFRPVQPLNGRKVFQSGGAVILVSSALLLAAIATALGLSQPN
ncbi:carbonic anhydrase 4-like [Perca flavescens]|uniref:carbonic anhydrase 4-like n=1 Tax=Perca flavescens TaxID=8167 RepID=UPI00106E9DDD|nr:carbonic anhydrase 4-like [Perca flavescens]